MSNDFRSRNRDIDRARIGAIVDELIRLETETRPTETLKSAHEKWGKARHALHLMGFLLDELAGWAVDQTIGEILTDPVGDPDAHDVERSAAEYEFDNPAINRRILGALLHSLVGTADRGLFRQASIALHALDVGEVPPLVAPMRRSHGPRYTLSHCRLLAVLHVAFRRGVGQTKGEALEKVAEAFGCAPATVDSWEERELVKVISTEDLNALTDAARRRGKRQLEGITDEVMVAKFLDPVARVNFSDESLEEEGRVYQEVLRTSVSSKIC